MANPARMYNVKPCEAGWRRPGKTGDGFRRSELIEKECVRLTYGE